MTTKRMIQVEYAALGLVVLFTALGWALSGRAGPGKMRVINLIASGGQLSPQVIRVNLGDQLELRLASADAPRDFRLDGYALRVKMTCPQALQRTPGRLAATDLVRTSVLANRLGSFSFGCSSSSAAAGDSLQGKLIVGLDHTSGVLVGAVLGIVVATIWLWCLHWTYPKWGEKGSASASSPPASC